MYTIDKGDGIVVRYPSVTARLQLLNKPMLLPWAKKCVGDYILDHINDLRRALTLTEVKEIIDEAKRADIKKRDGAADIGSLAHAECERFLRKQITVEQSNPAVRHMVSAFADWCTKVNFEMLRAEETVFSDKEEYAGTLDIAGMATDVDGDGSRRMCVVDIKTSSGIYPEMRFQVAAYGEALNEMGVDGLQPVTAGWIVKLAKVADDPVPFEACYIPPAEMQECAAVFMHLNNIGKYFDAHAGPAHNKKPKIVTEAAPAA